MITGLQIITQFTFRLNYKMEVKRGRKAAHHQELKKKDNIGYKVSFKVLIIFVF